MSQILEAARQFFDACETGRGWEVCKAYCHPDASFSAQADALSGMTTVEAYTEWAKGILTPLPDGHYELKFFAPDSSDTAVSAVATFHGTHTGEGGPVPPTGQAAATDYVYLLQFDGDRIRHMTKIWNDGYGLRQLGWA